VKFEWDVRKNAGFGVRPGGSLRIVLLVAVFVAMSFATLRCSFAQEPQNPPSDPKTDQSQSQSQGQSPGKENPPADSTPPSSPPPQASPSTPSSQSPQSSDKPSADKPEDKKDDTPNPAQVVAEATKQAATATLVKVRDWETEWLVGAYVSRNRKLVTLTAEQRKKLYLHQTLLTPGAYLKEMFEAGIDQARGVPYQWGGGVGGYAERFASREGQFLASNSLTALGDAKLGYEPRYDQCRCRGFWPRMRHAMVRNFLTYDRSEQEMRPQWGLYGGAFGGGMIATAWLPKPRNPFAEGGYAALGQAGFGIVANFFTEFAVDINRKLGAK
jgi:hypothetical protein